jgi:drug/metabolite transporter (DMT)-like permease
MRVIHYLALFGLGMLWSCSFFFIKIGVQEFPPITMMAVRLLLTSLISVPLFHTLGRIPSYWRQYWRASLVLGVLNLTIPWALLFWGEQFIDSSLAAILVATSTLWTAAFNHFWPNGERLSARRFGGVLLGFVGVLVLINPASLSLHSMSSVGAVAVLGTAMSYSVAAIYSRRAFAGVPVELPALGQSLGATVVSLPALLAMPPLEQISPGGWGAILFLTVGSTIVAYHIYFYLIEQVGAVRTMLMAYLLPVGGLFWGVALLGERPEPATIAGLLLVLASIGLVAGAPVAWPRFTVPLRR